VDELGRAYVTGQTNARDFPLVNPAQSTNAGGFFDAFYAVLSEDGSHLLQSSYFGGSGWDQAFSIALDGAGRAAVVGTTDSTDLPVRRAVQSVYRGVADAFGHGGNDGFVLVVDTNAGQVMSSSSLGGSGDDFIQDIFTAKGADVAADANGNFYITGWTSSADFRTVNAEQAVFGGIRDAVFVRLAANAPRTVDIRPAAITATEGQAFSGPVAFFTDTGDGVAEDYLVSLDWGDGVVTGGTVLVDGIGGHTIIGNHTYSDIGDYPSRITVRDPDGSFHEAKTVPGGTTAGQVIYHFEIDTSSLLGQSGFIALQFNPAALPGADAATARIKNIVIGGGALGSLASEGGASGSLANEVTITNSSRLNRLTQEIAFGTRLSFDLALSGDALSNPMQQIFGTSFALQLLAVDGRNVLLSTAPHGATAIVDLRGDGSSQSRATGVPPAIAAVSARASASVINAPIQLTVLPFNALEGVPFTTVVATFINNNPFETAAGHGVLINWGDNTTPTSGIVALAAGGGFTVTGSHMYAQVGFYLLRVEVTDEDGVTTKSELIIAGLQAGRLAPGNGVLAVGDVNGDGITDAIVSLAGGAEF
ncbi:MAG: NF038129 family PEP-CTERM protein, partial [Candidatus Binataceae bacterium]